MVLYRKILLSSLLATVQQAELGIGTDWLNHAAKHLCAPNIAWSERLGYKDLKLEGRAARIENKNSAPRVDAHCGLPWLRGIVKQESYVSPMNMVCKPQFKKRAMSKGRVLCRT